MTAPVRAPLMTRRINRNLLLTVGDGAETVAQQTAALSRVMVADDLPFAIAPLSAHGALSGGDAQEELARRLAAACDELTDATLADNLRQHGLSIAFEDDLHVWLLAELHDEQACSENALHALRLLEEIAWRRGRMTVIPHLLLLAEPEFQDRLGDWGGELAKWCGNQLFLAGAINLHHLRLSPARWQCNAAAALALLLWSHTPSHSSMAQSATGEMSFCALGAALWPAPRGLLRRWCEHWWVGSLGRRLTSGGMSADDDASQVMVNELRLREAELSGAAPGALAAWSARGWRPGWGGLATAGGDLLSRANRRDERRRQEQERGRLAWLHERLSQWQESLSRRAAHHLTPRQHWPGPALWRTELEELALRLQTECARIDAELSVAGQRLAAAEGVLTRETQALDGLCRSFPVHSLRGLLALAFQPWRWPVWAWRYGMTLPRQAQQLLDALAARNQRAAAEANLHTLRQLVLAAAQDVRIQSGELHTLCRLLAEMLELAEAVLAQTEAEIRPPWTRERLQRLFSALVEDENNLAWELFEQWPLSVWGGASAADVLERAAMHIGAGLAPLEAASAAGLLSLAFAPTVLAADGAAQSVGEWLAGLYRAAAPLWPVSEAQHEVHSECWFFAPDSTAANELTCLFAPGADEIRVWAEGQPDLLIAEGAADAVAILRWARVDCLAGP